MIGGILALAIVYTYKKDESSKKYKLMMALGLIFGVAMIILAMSEYTTWDLFTSFIIILLGFTMVIRPFRKVEIAVIIGLIVIVMTYVLLGSCSDIGGLEVLASGWSRVIAAFAAGAIVYMTASFAEKIVMLLGKLFNWWPFLTLLAIICIAESLCLLMTGHSIHSYISELMSGDLAFVM